MKLGKEGWLISFAKSMYRNVWSRVNVSSSLSDGFLFQLGLQQSSVLKSLLYTIELEVLPSRIRWSECPKELLYAGDLVLFSKLRGF